MGRPLKIAKAQAILTLDSCTAATSTVLVTNDLLDPASSAYGVTKGMPFIPATTVGTNLIAGTTFWILNITGNSTFTVSSTDLSTNRYSTPLTLTNDGTNSVLSVGVVDSGFSNPDGSTTATNATTYGTVGGNTGIYGSQILARAAIGVAGQATLDVNTATAILNLLNTAVDVSSFVSVGDWIGLNDQTYVGTVIGNSGLVTETTVSAESATDSVELSSSLTLIIGGAIVFGAAIGGLTAGVVYYVKSKPTATSITVSLTPGGALLPLTDDLALVTTATQNCLTLGAVSAVTARTTTWIYARNEAAFIVRQKGKTKYLVTGASGLTGACFTANVANASLSANTFNVIGTYAGGGGTKFVKSINDYQSEVFPTTVAATALVAGTLYTIYSAGTTDWTAVGAASSMTGVTFIARAAGTGTGTAVVNTVNTDIIGTFGTPYVANTYGGQPNPIVTIANS
jgi:hypothetical protein